MKLYLIGYMGSGKTTIGKAISGKLHWDFFDMDELIEQRYGMEVSEIFRLFGENEFRGAEQEILKELTEKENAVVSTGGGAPCFYDNMELMNKTGKTFYLNFSPAFLAERLLLTDLEKRPILARLQKEELKNFIGENLSKREAFYLQAQHKVTGTDEEITEKILKIIEKEDW